MAIPVRSGAFCPHRIHRLMLSLFAMLTHCFARETNVLSMSGSTLERDFILYEIILTINTRFWGGLWGARKGVIHNIQALLDQWPHKSSYGDDQKFLSSVVYPMIKHSALVHSDFIYYEDEDPRPIAVKRYGDSWLGFPPARGAITAKRLDDFRMLKNSPIRCLPAPSVAS